MGEKLLMKVIPSSEHSVAETHRANSEVLENPLAVSNCAAIS